MEHSSKPITACRFRQTGFFLLCVLFFEAGCHKSSAPPNTIVGTWQDVSSTISGCNASCLGCNKVTPCLVCERTTFFSDGHFTSNDFLGQQTDTGSYSVSGNSLTLKGTVQCTYFISGNSLNITYPRDPASGCVTTGTSRRV